MKRAKFYFIICLITSFISNYSLLKVEAADNDSVPVSARVVLPENQFNKEASYFYLKMTPNQEQDLEVVLSNTSDSVQKVEVSLAAGITNDNGIIDYPDGQKKFDASLKYPFSKLASTEKNVTIDPKSDKSVMIKVKMPAEEFDGLIIGGINIRLNQADDTKKESEGGMQIKNIIRYNFGVVLVENETVIVPEMKMNKAFPSQVMGVNTVKANLSNTEPGIIDGLEVVVKVTKKGSKEVLYEATKQGLRMAPNSTFDFGVSMDNKAYQAGDYTMSVVAKAENPDKEWSWNKDFTVDRETAQKLNAKAADLEKDYSMYWIVGGIVIGVLLVVVILCIIFYRKKKKKAEAERRKRQAQKRKRKKAPTNRPNKKRPIAGEMSTKRSEKNKK